MKYRIRVVLPGVCYWTSKMTEPDEKAWWVDVEGLKEMLRSGMPVSLEDEDGNTHVFPPELLGRCVISLERCT